MMKRFFCKVRTVAMASFCLLVSSDVWSDLSDLYVEAPPFWTSVASACTVNPSDMDKFYFSGSDVGFASGKISSVNPLLGTYRSIIARCNITNPLDGSTVVYNPYTFTLEIKPNENPVWSALIVGYQDPDGKGTAYSVTATVYAVSRPAGTRIKVVGFNSSVNSTVVAGSRGEDLVEFSHSWDFKKYEYYVELGMIRKNTLKNPVIYSVRLEHAWKQPY